MREKVSNLNASVARLEVRNEVTDCGFKIQQPSGMQYAGCQSGGGHFCDAGDIEYGGGVGGSECLRKNASGVREDGGLKGVYVLKMSLFACGSHFA